MTSNASRWGSLFLFFALLFGALVRFAPTALAGWPINDGGMFLVLMEELKASQFALPAFTAYNGASIPFAYPPLALYLGAALSSLGIPTVELLRWLPALASTISILAFYWLASELLGSPSKAGLAAAAYALMPRSFSWYIMGGGLSRSFGMLFLLLTCAAAWRLFSKPGWRSLLLTIICGAAAVLSHPETALHTAVACALIWLFRGRSARGLRDAALVALGILVLTSPWWATVLVRHSLAPFKSALQTGAHTPAFLLAWLRFDFAQEPFVALLTALGLAGLVVQLVRRQWLLPVWTLLPFAVEPRSGPAIAALPLAMLAGIGLTDFVIPAVASLSADAAATARDWADGLSSSPAARLVTGAVLIYAFFAAFAYDLSLARLVVPPQGRLAMQWVSANTPAGARFLVLTGAPDPFGDATAEWFPALTRRTSLNTVQGREWTLGAAFMPFLQSSAALQACVSRTSSCLDTWVGEEPSATFDYVYVQGTPGEHVLDATPLAQSLLKDAAYRLVFDGGDVAIFQRK